MTYELGLYIPDDGILLSYHRGNPKPYITLSGWPQYRRRNVCPVRYELGLNMPEDGIRYSHRRGNLKYYMLLHN
jgi:hypothetical protein